MPSHIIIREAENRDTRSITILLAQLGYAHDEAFVIRKLEELSKQAMTKVFVAEESQKVIGFLSFSADSAFHREGNIGTITAMCVIEGSRKRGIGRILIEHVEAYAKEAGCVRIAVASGIQRTETHQFYRNMGYEEKTKRFVKDFEPQH